MEQIFRWLGLIENKLCRACRFHYAPTPVPSSLRAQILCTHESALQWLPFVDYPVQVSLWCARSTTVIRASDDHRTRNFNDIWSETETVQWLATEPNNFPSEFETDINHSKQTWTSNKRTRSKLCIIPVHVMCDGGPSPTTIHFHHQNESFTNTDANRRSQQQAHIMRCRTHKRIKQNCKLTNTVHIMWMVGLCWHGSQIDMGKQKHKQKVCITLYLKETQKKCNYYGISLQ